MPKYDPLFGELPTNPQEAQNYQLPNYQEQYENMKNPSSASQLSDLLNSGQDPLEILKQLAEGDEAYLGQYIETLLARQDTASARSFSEWMDSTKYSRAFEDIKKAGYNPWLALQGGLGVSGSQEYSPSRTSSSNAYSLSTARKSAEASERNSKRQIASTIISAVSSALMLAILMMA